MNKDTNEGERRPLPSATTDEGMENECIALAYDLVKERLRKGTATSQETVHFLKLGSSKERLEKELVAQQVELARAKTENFQEAKKIEDLFNNAIIAFKSYHSGSEDFDEEE